MKKAHELAVLCQLSINISFYDPQINRVVEFASNPDFALHDLNVMMMTGKAPSQGEKKMSKALKYKLLTSKDIMDSAGNFSMGTMTVDDCSDFDDFTLN